METLGDFLQQMREQRGIKLEQVAAQTKISVKMLKALEANDYSQIPNEVVAKGFIRAYARFLAIDEAEMFNRYRESVPQHAPVSRESDSYRHLPLPTPAYQHWGAKLVTASVFAVMAVLVLFVIGKKQPPAPEQASLIAPAVSINGDQAPGVEAGVMETEKAETGVKEETASNPSKSGKNKTFPVELTVNVPGQPAQSIQVPSGTGQRDLTLVIEASERSWVVAHIDDQIVKEVLLQPGEKIRLGARNKIVLTLGNAGGVQLKFNGKVLDPVGPPGKVVKNITLTR